MPENTTQRISPPGTRGLRNDCLAGEKNNQSFQMIQQLLFVVTLLSALGCGVVGGVFFAFSVFVMKALARLPSPKGIAAMQAINIAVLNRVFFTAFFGTGAGCVLLAVSSVFLWSGSDAIYRFVGSLLYLAGTIFVTIAFNVPRNEALASIDPDSASGARLWADYVANWTAWNQVRTIAAVAAAALLTLALVKG
jgi:uncharacterized membrane protein